MTRTPAPLSEPTRPRPASRQGLRPAACSGAFDTSSSDARPLAGARPTPQRRPAARARLEAEARTRMIRRLQDALSQSLFAGSLLAHSIGRLQDPVDRPRLRDGVDALQRLHRGAQAELRMLELEQEPVALSRARLSDLLRLPLDALAGRGGAQVDATIDHAEGRAGIPGRHVYRIAQEALSNAGRHGGASRVVLSWTLAADGSARLRIADDGCGFDPADRRPRPGLADIRRRAAAIGARLALHAAPGRGCELILDLPRRQ